MFRAIVVLAAALCATNASAQWPAHFDRGAPRKADGTVNLDAPTPRTQDGKPDFTGVWVNAWFVDGRVLPLPVSPPGEPPAATFGDVFANFKEPLPLQPWAAQLKAARKEQNSKDNPDAHCLPMGLIQFHMHPQPRKLVQTPDVLVTLYEGNAGIRQIFTDGRSLPPSDAQPWWYGYSVGHWEGDTLVVETRGFRDDLWIDTWGSPMSDVAKMTERIRRPNFGTLEIDLTIDDPKNYTGPFTVKLAQDLEPDTELVDEFCAEGENSYQRMIRSRGK